MAQALIRKLNDDTLAAYRASAKARGRSLEAELRDVIERNRPMRAKDPEALGALALRLRAMTLNSGHDSTAYLRQLRDGRDPDLVD
jgi:plasmid stability protein